MTETRKKIILLVAAILLSIGILIGAVAVFQAVLDFFITGRKDPYIFSPDNRCSRRDQRGHPAPFPAAFSGDRGCRTARYAPGSSG